MDRYRISLYNIDEKDAATDKQLHYMRHLFERKGIKFPFGTNGKAKRKLTKNDASRIIDAIKKGKPIKIYSI
jgi:hypothetical protein